jgi:uncharacterized protein
MLARILSPSNSSFFLFGPRGTGKSTWLKDHFRNAPVYDLLNTRVFLRLSGDPSVLFDEVGSLPSGSWVVIDEVQKIPQLLNEVHRLIEDKKIRFALSGSSARKIRKRGENLLAGRARVTNMFPFTSSEIEFDIDIERTLSYGMLPSVFNVEDPKDYLRSYVETYLQQEIKAEALTRNLGGFVRFLEIAARQNGQVTNVSNIARDAQVARQTVQGYFEILVDTLVGFWLPAWKLKRATKQIAHSKFYFFDPGVCRSMSNRAPYPLQPEEMGHLFETYILHEVRSYLHYTGKHYPIYFWSSPDGVEVDLFLETQKGYFAVEMKSGKLWYSRFNRGLKRIQEEYQLKTDQLLGIYYGEKDLTVDGITVLTIQNFLQRLWEDSLII